MGSTAPTLSMVLLTRNSRKTIRPCLASFFDHVDEVVVVDTGSRDGTVEEVRRFARERGEMDKLVLGRFRWCDDFAQARNEAHALASGAWHCWLDADDIVLGAHRLRALIATASPETIWFFAPYHYHRANQLASDSWSWMPRLLRGFPNNFHWMHPVYEIPAPYDVGNIRHMRLVTDAHWEHRRGDDTWRTSFDRNGRILRRWAREEPEHPNQLYATAVWLCCAGRPNAAERPLRTLVEQLGRKSNWPCFPFLRSQGATCLGELLAERAQNEPRRESALIAEARELATRALREHPENPARARLLLANLACWDYDYEGAIEEARAGLLFSGDILAITDDEERALAFFHGRGMELVPLCQTLVAACCKLGRPEDALEDVYRALTISEDSQLRTLWKQLQRACKEARGPLAVAVPSVAALRPVLAGAR